MIQRRKFNACLGLGTMSMLTLTGLQELVAGLDFQGAKTPLLFVGHGSPMNAIEDNEFSRQWAKLGSQLPKPQVILCISAHWLTRGTHVTAMPKPPTIHDFRGFPKPLFEVEYPAPGSPEVAEQTKHLIKSAVVQMDHREWGLDHGSWSVLRGMYPDADVPVLQLSIDYSKPARYHFELAKELAALRNKGVLILGSGNIVHNLSRIDFSRTDGFEWAETANEAIKQRIADREFEALLDYTSLGKDVMLAIPTPDHYFPLIYTLGLVEKEESIAFFNDKTTIGSISMTSLIVSKPAR